MIFIASLQTNRKHVAMRGVQDRIFGEIHENCEAVPLAAAENDQISLGFLGGAQDLGLGVTPRHLASRSSARRINSCSISLDGIKDSPIGSMGTNSTTCNARISALEKPAMR